MRCGSWTRKPPPSLETCWRRLADKKKPPVSRGLECPRRDSNPYASRRQPLKLVCLPVPPPGHFIRNSLSESDALIPDRLTGGRGKSVARKLLGGNRVAGRALVLRRSRRARRFLRSRRSGGRHRARGRRSARG